MRVARIASQRIDHPLIEEIAPGSYRRRRDEDAVDPAKV
jgi:hypothetical protein